MVRAEPPSVKTGSAGRGLAAGVGSSRPDAAFPTTSLDKPRNRMMRPGAYKSLGCAGAATIMLLFGTGPVWGQQQATITGKVTDSEGKPLGGATVVFREIPSGGTTNLQGVYTITIPPERVKGQSLTMVARYLGKAPRTHSVSVNAGPPTGDLQP